MYKFNFTGYNSQFIIDFHRVCNSMKNGPQYQYLSRINNNLTRNFDYNKIKLFDY